MLCWLWIEEAYEVNNEDDFNTLDESIRGVIPAGLFKQATLTLNPWNDRHWIKKRFFDAPPDSDILAITTTYQCNEWLDDSDKKLFSDMKKNNPRRYVVAGLGEWGAVQGLVYENWEERLFDRLEVSERGGVVSAFGLDFGYTNDPTALFCGLVDKSSMEIYVFDELYSKALTNYKIWEAVRDMGYSKEVIIADSAEPKSIDELRGYGLSRIRAARKGRDSVNNGIQFLQGYKIIIHPKCVNFLREISNYTWETDRSGARLNVPIGDFNHLMDAMRYGMENILMPKKQAGVLF